MKRQSILAGSLLLGLALVVGLGCDGGDTTGPGPEPAGSPAPVGGLQAAPGVHTITLAWTNPNDGDFSEACVRYATDGYPQSPSAGTLLGCYAGSPGARGTATHQGLGWGTVYYYSVFAKRADVDVSEAKCVTEEPLGTAEEIVAAGWAHFAAGDTESADERFREAIESHGDYADAYTGRGWVALRRDNLAAAIEQFTRAITHDPAAIDAYAGLAVASRDVDPPDYASAVDSARETLGRDAGYEMVHEQGLGWWHLRLIMAQSLFALGSYDEANDEVRVLDDTLAADPASTTYVQDLLLAIEVLGRRGRLWS
jgi:tetratricopeptide (TPR) repeat protein